MLGRSLSNGCTHAGPHSSNWCANITYSSACSSNGCTHAGPHSSNSCTNTTYSSAYSFNLCTHAGPSYSNLGSRPHASSYHRLQRAAAARRPGGAG